MFTWHRTVQVPMIIPRVSDGLNLSMVFELPRAVCDDSLDWDVVANILRLRPAVWRGSQALRQLLFRHANQPETRVSWGE